MCSLAVVVFLALASAGMADESKPPPAVSLSADEQKLLDLINEERKKENVPALTLDPLLCKVARAHAENMARSETISHALDGKMVGDRVTATGYDWSVVRENLARVEDSGDKTPDPAQIHKSWMKSTAPRANIVEAKVTQIGLGRVRSKKGDWYYTLVLAAPRK